MKSLDLTILVDAEAEATLAIQSLRRNTLSKLTFADSKKFDALVKDVFPDVKFKDVDYAELRSALVETAQEMGLIVSEVQVKELWDHVLLQFLL